MLGRSRWEKGVLPGVLTILWPWRLAGTVPCTSKKNPDLPPHPQKLRGCSCRGPEQYSYNTPFSLRIRHSAAGRRAFWASGGGRRLSRTRRGRATAQGLGAGWLRSSWREPRLTSDAGGVTVVRTALRAADAIHDAAPPGTPAAPDPGGTSTSPTAMCPPGVPQCPPHQPRSAERKPTDSER